VALPLLQASLAEPQHPASNIFRLRLLAVCGPGRHPSWTPGTSGDAPVVAVLELECKPG